MVGQTFSLEIQKDFIHLAVSTFTSCSPSQDLLGSHLREGGSSSLVGYQLLLISLGHSGDPEICVVTLRVLLPTKPQALLHFRDPKNSEQVSTLVGVVTHIQGWGGRWFHKSSCHPLVETLCAQQNLIPTGPT